MKIRRGRRNVRENKRKGERETKRERKREDYYMLSLSLYVSKSVLFQSFFSQFSHYNANKITHSFSLSFFLSFPLSQSFFLSHLPIKRMPSKRVYHICINILNRNSNLLFHSPFFFLPLLIFFSFFFFSLFFLSFSLLFFSLSSLWHFLTQENLNKIMVIKNGEETRKSEREKMKEKTERERSKRSPSGTSFHFKRVRVTENALFLGHELRSVFLSPSLSLFLFLFLSVSFFSPSLWNIFSKEGQKRLIKRGENVIRYS